MAGLQVLAGIRADSDLCELAVIMLTAPGEQGQVSAFRDGADAHLIKPLDVVDVIDTVQQVASLTSGQRAQHRRVEAERAALLARVEEVGLTIVPFIHAGRSTW